MPLTPAQEAADERMAQALLDAGWERTTAGRAFGFAHLQRRNDHAHMTTYHHYDDATVVLHVSNLEQSAGARGLIAYDDDLDSFLDILTAAQDTLSIDSLGALLRRFAEAGHETYSLDGDIATEMLP